MKFREVKKEDREFILKANREINELSGLNDSTLEKRIDKDLFEDKSCKLIIAEIDIREDNKFDSNAIMIFTEAKRKLGYVPEKDNLIFARLMDAGKILKAKITDITKKGTLHQISVGIFLVDF